MQYYTLPLIGTGTEADPYRPDVPDGTSWVGNTDGTDCLIATPTDLPIAPGRTKQLPEQDLENACNARGIEYNDVLTWHV